MLRLFLTVIGLLWATAATAQVGLEPLPDRQTGEGSGPHATLVIRGATMIDGMSAAR